MSILIAMVLFMLSISALIGAAEGLSSETPSSPSWERLECQLGSKVTPPIDIDSVLNPSKLQFSADRPTLFRERHGWCPYSERVWLTLEIIGTEYDTVRIDNTGGPRPSNYGGQTPQIRWPNGKQQGESMDIVFDLDSTYNNGMLFQSSDVNNRIKAFRKIFPRARPSSRAAFLFQHNGEPMWRGTFEKTLEETNELLESTSGPFFCGSQLSAADIAWAPFLERYRYQLPCLHDRLEPDNKIEYPNLAAWYAAMDAIPVYACRVKGDAGSWRKVLKMAGFGNSGFPPTIQANIDSRIQIVEFHIAEQCINFDTWDKYSASRSFVAGTPHGEAAAVILRNREAVIKDIMKQVFDSSSPYSHQSDWKCMLPLDESRMEWILLDLAQLLIETGESRIASPSECSAEVACLASFLDQRMCVPRDMGAMSAACIKLVSYSHGMTR